MRLWSLHPKYLDAKGLVALWREGLLALRVLKGCTKGYKHHPQLIRFRETKNPVYTMNSYLLKVYEESVSRGYSFNAAKIRQVHETGLLKVTTCQLEYEMEHLKQKLKLRDPVRYSELKSIDLPEPNPLCITVPGEIEKWEKIR